MSDPVLFLAADPRELTSWVNRWEDVRPVSLAVNWARTGKWQGRPVAAIANGAGAERAFADDAAHRSSDIAAREGSALLESAGV